MNGVYQLKKIIKDTALMEDDYHCFLMNVKTNEIIGQLENDSFLYDKDETIVRDRFYFLGRKGLTSIYDAKKEQFVLIHSLLRNFYIVHFSLHLIHNLN